MDINDDGLVAVRTRNSHHNLICRDLVKRLLVIKLRFPRTHFEEQGDVADEKYYLLTSVHESQRAATSTPHHNSIPRDVSERPPVIVDVNRGKILDGS